MYSGCATDLHRQQKVVKSGLGGAPLPLVSKSIIAHEEEKSKHFVIDSPCRGFDGLVEGNGGRLGCIPAGGCGGNSSSGVLEKVR